MNSETDDRNIDDDPTLKIGALQTTSSSAVGLRSELFDPTRAELSWDILRVLRVMTAPAPRKVKFHLPAVTSPARVAAIHSRPTQNADASVVLATLLALVTATGGRLAAIGRRHAMSFAKTLSLLATESVARVRRNVTGVAFLRRSLLLRRQ